MCNPPKSKFGVWTFSAALPEKTAPCVIKFSTRKQIMIMISLRAPNRQSRPQRAPLVNFNRGWMTNLGKTQEKAVEKQPEVAPTVPDAQTSQPQ